MGKVVKRQSDLLCLQHDSGKQEGAAVGAWPPKAERHVLTREYPFGCYAENSHAT
jgi:hypothetical protein